MTDRNNRDFDNIIGSFSLDGENRPEKAEDAAAPNRTTSFVNASLSFALAVFITAMWATVAGLGVMFLLDTLNEVGVTTLPQPGFFDSWAIGISLILIVAALRQGSR